MIHLIINTSIKNGRGPPRYETAHQITMEKFPGNNKIYRLRRINKCESEYNLILRYFWPHIAAHNAEDAKIMGTHQHGGRKNHQAQDPVMINEFIIEYHRMMYLPLLITQHDNTACFDHTVHNITNICNQNYSIPKSIFEFVTTTKQNTRYHALTILGYSTNFYQHSKQYPVWWSGQGSGNACTELNFLSIFVLKTLEDTSDVFTILGPDGTKWKQASSIKTKPYHTMQHQLQW